MNGCNYYGPLRRSNTCQRIQTLMNQSVSSSNVGKEKQSSTQSLFSISSSSLIIEDINTDDIEFGEKPVRREIQVAKLTGRPFGAEFVNINDAVYCAYVSKNSPAYRCGIKFGDQLLAVGDQDISLFPSTEIIVSELKKLNVVNISVVDSPLVKVFTLKRDFVTQPWGFTIKHNKITHISSRSPAEKAGIETGFGIVEINDENVFLSSKREISSLVNVGYLRDRTVTKLAVMDAEVMEEFHVFLSSLVFARVSEKAAVKKPLSPALTRRSFTNQSPIMQGGNLSRSVLSSSLSSLNSVL